MKKAIFFLTCLLFSIFLHAQDYQVQRGNRAFIKAGDSLCIIIGTDTTTIHATNVLVIDGNKKVIITDDLFVPNLNIGDTLWFGDGTYMVKASVDASGSDKQIQFNDGGDFGAKNTLVFDKTSNALTVGTRSGVTGMQSLVQGTNCNAGGNNSHAEGQGTSATGDYGSHSEGYNTSASGWCSHAEGDGTQASSWSHSQNYRTIATGNSSHAEGHYTTASNNGCHSGGWGESSSNRVIASREGAFNHSTVSLTYSGVGANANYSAILGGVDNTILSSADSSVVLGGGNQTADEPNTVYLPKLLLTDVTATSVTNGAIRWNGSNFQGYKSGGWIDLDGSGAFSTTSNITSNAPGNYAVDDFIFGAPQINQDGNSNHYAKVVFDKSKGAFRAGMVTDTRWNNRGDYSAGFGLNCESSGLASFTAGINSSAGNQSVAIGGSCQATGQFSGAFGNNSRAPGSMAFSMGNNCYANGDYSFTLGDNAHSGTGTNHNYAFGKSFTNSTSNSFEVGFGKADFSVRSNETQVKGKLTINGSGHAGTTNLLDLKDDLDVSKLTLTDMGDLSLSGSVKFGIPTATASAGMVQWDGTNFKGYNGSGWRQLDLPNGSTYGNLLLWDSYFNRWSVASGIKFLDMSRALSMGVDTYYNTLLSLKTVEPAGYGHFLQGEDANGILRIQINDLGDITTTGDVDIDGVYKSGGQTGMTGTITVVTDVRNNAGQLQKRELRITITGGIITRTLESVWLNTNDIPLIDIEEVVPVQE